MYASPPRTAAPRMPRICLRCCCPTAVPMAPGDVPVMATGLSRQTFSVTGLEPQSIAFLRTAGSDLLNSGMTMKTASARRISSVNLRTGSGRSTSRSPLYMGSSPSGMPKNFSPGGASWTIASASLRLIDSRRRLPTIRPTWWATLVMGELLGLRTIRRHGSLSRRSVHRRAEKADGLFGRGGATSRRPGRPRGSAASQDSEGVGQVGTGGDRPLAVDQLADRGAGPARPDHLVRVEGDADRVLLELRTGHVGGGIVDVGEVVDLHLDEVTVRVAVVDRGGNPVLDRY